MPTVDRLSIARAVQEARSDLPSPEYGADDPGAAGLHDALTRAYTLSDLRFEVENPLSEDDRLGFQRVATGTLDGPLTTAKGKVTPVTSRQERVTFVWISEVKQGPMPLRLILARPRQSPGRRQVRQRSDFGPKPWRSSPEIKP